MPLDKIIAERTEELPYQELGKLLSIVAKDKSIISFGPGQPDFGPPPHVIKAAQKALDDPASSRYSSPEGSFELREAIAEKLKKENRINLPAENVLITSGSCEAILLSMLSCVDPGEEVAVVDPSYINYIPCVELLNGSAISLPVVPSSNWQLLPELVKKQIKEPKRMRAIIINTPANPTGAVYTKKTLEEIADIARDNDMMIVSDEAYEKFVFGKAKHVSIGSLNGMNDYVLTLQSFSKTYGMPGFRVGYAAGPKKVIDVMREMHLFASMCAPTISQIAAVAALKGPQDSIRRHTIEYGKRREFLLKRLEELGFVCDCDPEGAFYMFPKVPGKMTSVNFAHWLMKEAKVLVVPGSDFGRYGEGYVRFSYSTAMPKIVEGLERIENAMKKLR
ncbi:MAG: pyridoxal phosphate-dependent aminotransferase [Candidatus Aenigmatarchaeota archaeon]